MGSKSPTQTSQQQTSTPNPAALAAYQNVVSQAQTAAATPYKAYTGELTAGTNAEEGAAQNTINGLSGTANGYYNTASQQGTLGAAAVNPTAVNGAAIQQYESPYENQVIQATQAQIANTDAQQSQQQTSNAIGAGAFGGDRAGVAQAALAGQQAIANNATLASLNNQNYSQALGEANTQQATTLGADQANRTAIQNNASLQAGLGSAATTSGLGIASGQLSSGALSQQTQQAADTANYGQFENQQAYPFQTTQYLANIVEGIEPNTGTTTSGTATQSAPSSLNSIIGGGLGLAGLFSDERVKEDIKPIGKTYDGQTMYSFKYKGDHTTRVGLMAQDVEKKHPHAVGSLGGIKTVDYDKATSAAANRGHFASGGGVTDAIAKLRVEMDRLSGAGRTQTSPSQTASRSASANGSQKEFADRVKDVSSKISTHPFKDRAAISQVYDAYGKVHPDAGSLSSFKERLVGAAKQQHLTLSRVDLPERMDRDTRERSESPYGSDSVHYVNHDKSRYAFGGVVPGGMGSQPYGGSTTGYVPLASGQLPSAHTQQPNLNLTQGLGATQTGATMQSPGMQNMMAGAKLFSNSDAGQSMKNSIQDFGQDFAADPASTLGFNRGGNVVGLGAARMRRHYDGGGTVPDADAMVFDPTALATGTDGGATFQPGFSGSTAPSGFAPPPSQGLGAAVMSPAAPSYSDPSTWGGQGLGAAAIAPTSASSPAPRQAQLAPAGPVAMADPNSWSTQALGAAAMPLNDNTSNLGGVPAAPAVTPAPVMKPVDRYQSPTGTAAPASTGGLGAASTGPAPAPGALGAINTATAPRSVRNANPGNIEDGAFAQRQPGYVGSDGRFAKFESPAAGYAAMDTLLAGYGAKGLNTPLSIVSTWAPKGDGGNDPTAYAGSVAKQLGIGINDPIDMHDSAARGALAKAMANVEGGTGGTGVSPPTGSLAYSAQAGADAANRGLGAAATPGTPNGLGAAKTGSWTDNFGSLIGGTGTPSEGRSGGVLGLFPGMSDDARLGLMAMGAGMAASGSRNWGMALGQGAQAGIQGYQAAQKISTEAGYRKAQAANIASEINNRTVLQGQSQQTIDQAAKKLLADLGEISARSKEATARAAAIPIQAGAQAQNAQTNALEARAKRYTVIPGPDNTFSAIDNYNPGRGLLRGDQIMSDLSGNQQGPGSSGSAGGNPPPSAGALGPGTQPAPAGTSVPIDSSNFMKTGNPTLKAPQGYLPTNYYQNQYRIKTDPVARASLEKQTGEDVNGANERAQKAYSGLYYSDEMDRNAAALPNSGALVPGGLFPERLGLAKNWNAAVTGLGLDGMQVDPNAVKAGESLIKDKTRLGSQLTSSLGSREAASVFGSMMAAVPGADNTRAGYKSISSSIRVLGQREIDHSAFMQDYAARYGNTSGAEVAFNQLNPPMQYARQAEALAKVPQTSVDLLRSNANNPNAIAAFERQYGPGTARYYTGQFAQ